MLFKDLNLKPSTLKAVEEMGFVAPSEIQEKSIPVLLEGDIDFVGQAQTGTGKTAAFVLPLLQKLDFKRNDVMSLIIAPTRELANQICEEIKKLSKFEPVRTLALYGGTSVSNQLRDLRKIKPQIVVGTPGRLIDFIDRGALNTKTCDFVVLDEADEMLDMGFFDDIKLILSQIENKKIWMFSATMPREIMSLINEHFCNPEHIKVTKKILTSDAIEQKYIVVKERDQTEALCRFLDYETNVYAIVFTRTKIGAKELTDELNMRGYPSDALHGDMSQDQRDLTMKKFKEKKLSLLVCTDVAARGIDVNDLTHVINFSLPQDNEAYVHRIGRTGRAGSKGVALSIVTPIEVRKLKGIERITKAEIHKIELPKVSEIKEVLISKALLNFSSGIETFEESVSFNNFKEKFDHLSKDDLLKGLYSFVFEEAMKRYENAKELTFETRDSGRRNERGSERMGGRGERSSRRNNEGQSGYQRFFINLGRNHNMDPGSLIKLIARNSKVRGAEVGRIDIKDGFSFFEVPVSLTSEASSLNGVVWMNRELNIEPAKAESREGRSGGGRFSSRGRSGGRGRSSYDNHARHARF